MVIAARYSVPSPFGAPPLRTICVVQWYFSVASLSKMRGKSVTSSVDQQENNTQTLTQTASIKQTVEC